MMEKDLMDIEGKSLDMVEAEFMNVRQSTIRSVEGGHIELQQVGALSIDGERIETTQGFSVLNRGNTLTLNQGVGLFNVAHTTNINYSCSPLSVSAADAVIEKSAVGVVAARDVTVTNSASVLMIARNVHGTVTTLLDWKSALAVGAVAGGILGALSLLRRSYGAVTTGRLLAPLIRETIRIALLEDLGQGDVTSLQVIAGDRSAKAAIRAKEEFILAGMPFVTEVFSVLDPDVSVITGHAEGASVTKGDIVAEVSGSAWSLLAGERTALNILQRISGVATLTRAFVDRVSGLPVRIADTRKTTPCMRYMEKYGVVVGGGVNHRFGLSDGVLIKDNHLKIAGSITVAVESARKDLTFRKVEVEVKTLDELREALAAGADIIMLDNMSVEHMTEASKIAGGKAVLEASGNVNLSNVRAIAETGVHVISVGALTHSARAVDISMKIL